jgi:hypothetical protein
MPPSTSLMTMEMMLRTKATIPTICPARFAPCRPK